MGFLDKLFGGSKKCGKCGGKTGGWKCSACGVEASTHDSAHTCGGDKCVPKCTACSQAESNCSCPTPAK